MAVIPDPDTLISVRYDSLTDYEEQREYEGLCEVIAERIVKADASFDTNATLRISFDMFSHYCGRFFTLEPTHHYPFPDEFPEICVAVDIPKPKSHLFDRLERELQDKGYLCKLVSFDRKFHSCIKVPGEKGFRKFGISRIHTLDVVVDWAHLRAARQANIKPARHKA